jgi:integrase
MMGMKPFTKERLRDRVLSDDELRWFWIGCERMEWPFGPMFQLLLLTGQRRDAVANMAWAEIDFKDRIWTLPSARAKNSRVHQVHFSAPAIMTLRTLSHIGDRLVSQLTAIQRSQGFRRPNAKSMH